MATAPSSAAPTASQHDALKPEFDMVTQFSEPNSIQEDGSFIYLPPSSERDNVAQWQYAIERHGLLRKDLDKVNDSQDGALPEGAEEEGFKKQEEPKIHPVLQASAQLQEYGINELNRVINLSRLTKEGAYFGLSNIIDSSLTDTKTDDEKANAALEEKKANERQVKAEYSLRRKCIQYADAAESLKSHRKQLAGAIVAQQQIDRRWRELRPRWLPTAPEHGTRAAPHAVRAIETIAVDIDVYGRSADGRLAQGVPRFATLDWATDYSAIEDVEKWSVGVENQKKQRELRGGRDLTLDSSTNDAMEVDEPQDAKVKTKAEPFIVLDADMEQVDNFNDSNKAQRLTLQLDIEKPSTSFRDSSQLDPCSLSDVEKEEDEDVFVSLQHSLFCAKLFQSIRKELAPETEAVGKTRSSHRQTYVWLNGESDENFLPPPNLMCGDETDGLSSLCVVYCHEGEVKVQLDGEYNVAIKLVDAKTSTESQETCDMDLDNSGSHSRERIKLISRTLLLHAQETFHRHMLEEQKRERKETQPADGLLERKVVGRSPRILQSCVSLGSKMLFEQRIRMVLKERSRALAADGITDPMSVEWLKVPIFDPNAHFTLSFRDWVVDAHLVRDELTVTQTMSNGAYRKATFHTAKELDLFLRMGLRRVLKRSPS